MAAALAKADLYALHAYLSSQIPKPFYANNLNTSVLQKWLPAILAVFWKLEWGVYEVYDVV